MSVGGSGVGGRAWGCARVGGSVALLYAVQTPPHLVVLGVRDVHDVAGGRDHHAPKRIAARPGAAPPRIVLKLTYFLRQRDASGGLGEVDLRKVRKMTYFRWIVAGAYKQLTLQRIMLV